MRALERFSILSFKLANFKHNNKKALSFASYMVVWPTFVNNVCLTCLPSTYPFLSGFFVNTSFLFIHSVQLMTMQKEMQKQMTTMISVPISKEGKKLETNLGRSMEKAVKANTDALWARFQEESAKNEKLLRDRTQQITSLINNFMNKDLPMMLEKAVKKEMTTVGPAVVRSITPAIEKTISSAIVESFQVNISRRRLVYETVVVAGSN